MNEKSKIDNLSNMDNLWELVNERKETVYKYDIKNMTASQKELLKAYALEHIKDDEDELVNYAVVRLLKEALGQTETKLKGQNGKKTKKVKKAI
jgi:vacuolar-type H+-ATPase subunit C/Vma6